MINLPRLESLAVLLIRLAFGYRLIWGTWDNIVSYDQMLEFRDFLELNGFPIPLISAFLSVYFQFIAGICWILGYQTKLMSSMMVLNFLTALSFVHVGDTYLGSAPAIHLMVISIFLLVKGPGKYSLEENLARHS